MVILIAGIFSLLFLTLPISTWPEESGWVCIAVKISLGEWLNPLRAKSDYPSSFQAIPIGILVYMGIFPVLASRLVAIGYLFCSGVFYALIAERFSKGNRFVVLLAFFLPFFSYCSSFYAIVGWHEVTHVHLLCSAITYFFYSLLMGTRLRKFHLIGLGVSVGFSCWTLYTPCLYALVVTSIFLVTPSHQIAKSEKVKFFIVLLFFLIPLALSISYYQGSQLHRHYKFFIEGGEWDRFRYSDKNTFKQAMFSHLRTVWKLITPHNTNHTFHSHTGIFPEWMILITSFVGLIFCVFDKSKCKAILLPFVLTFVGIILSNPTPWRMSIFGYFFITLSLVGFSMVYTVLPQKRASLLSSLLFLFIASIQILEYQAEILKAQRSFIEREIQKRRVYDYVNNLCKVGMKSN